MSYILDALRRADADRERGAVPGLHAQPAQAVAAPTGRRALWPWIALGVLAIALAAVVGGWRFGVPPEPEPKATAAVTANDVAPAAPADRAVAPAASAARAAPTAITPIVPANATAANTATAAPAGRSSLGASSAPAIIAAKAATAPASMASAPLASARNAVMSAPAPRLPRVAARASAASAASAPARAASSAPARVYARAELPADIKRDLPELVVGGATYSENPASRMLIVNGQIFREGDALAPGLLLRQIQLKSAVLEYKGYRYGIGF